MEPFNVDETYHAIKSFVCEDIEDSITSSEILAILNEHIPSSIRHDYRKFIEGVSIPKSKKESLIEVIKGVLAKYYYGTKDENR